MGNKKREKREEDEEGSQTAPVSKKARQEGLEQPAEASESYPESPGHNDSSQSQREKVEQLQLLVAAFSPKQQDQYEIFRRSTFPKSSIRRLMQNVCGSSILQNAVIAMSGMAKVYVGEIVEEACRSRDKAGEVGPLQPKHVREAARKLRQRDLVPNERYKKTFNFR